MYKLMRHVTTVAWLAISSALTAQGPLPTGLAPELRRQAGPYPLMQVSVVRGDSAVLVFGDSSMTGAALTAHTWMFGPPVTAAEADSCPPEKVLGRKLARIFWRAAGKDAQVKMVVVRVHGTVGIDRFSGTDLYYYPEQLEGPWAGDPEHTSFLASVATAQEGPAPTDGARFLLWVRAADTTKQASMSIAIAGTTFGSLGASPEFPGTVELGPGNQGKGSGNILGSLWERPGSVTFTSDVAGVDLDLRITNVDKPTKLKLGARGRTVVVTYSDRDGISVASRP